MLTWQGERRSYSIFPQYETKRTKLEYANQVIDYSIQANPLFKATNQREGRQSKGKVSFSIVVNERKRRRRDLDTINIYHWHWREDPFSSQAAFLCPWDSSSIGQNPVKAKAIGSTLTLIFKGGPFLSSLGQRKNDSPREDVTDL